ncbi:cytochrome P450 [Linnemannia elongata]|nr:cytochrome P450 [Linnemannia elongata]
MLYIPALILAFLIAICYKYRSHAPGAHPRPDLKEPKGAIPLLGHLLVVLSYPGAKLYDFFEKQNKELGPVWSISLPFFGRLIQGDEPKIVEHVLKTNFPNYIKGEMLTGLLEDIIGKGFFLVDGAEWSVVRKLIVQIFNIKAFREYTSDVFVIQGKKVIDYLGKAADEGFIVDIHGLMHQYTLDSFSVVMCGQSFGCLNNVEHKPPLAAAIDRLLAAAANRMLDPTQRIRERLTGASKTIVEDRALIKQFFRDIIERRRKEGHHAEKRDLLQLFIEWKNEDGISLPDDVILDNMFQITIGGYDTTAQGLSWMYYLIFRDGADKNIMKELIQEVDEVLQGVDPTYTTYRQQKYSEACFYEALRMFPSVPKNIRQCASDDVLPGGAKIHKGDWFSWSPLIMGRSELIWGPDANEYKPSRWMNTEKPSQYKFPSFNAGPRSCPGQQFSTIQAATIIGMIFQSFEMELVHPSKTPAYGMSMTLPMANGLAVRIHRRAVTRAN